MLWKGFLLSRFGALDCSDVFLLSVYQDCLFQSGRDIAAVDQPHSLIPSSDLKKRSRRKRRITFADVEGLPLESVHELLATDATYTPGKIVPRLEATLNSKSWSKSTPTNNNRSCTTRLCQFTQPGTSPDFFERLKGRKVMLEAVTPKHKLTHGMVRVINIAYDKEVVVRWTRNKWRSYRDSSCNYCQGSSDGSTDRFSFTLLTTPDDGDIEFVIRYKVDGREFWDNNNEQNYTITINR